MPGDAHPVVGSPQCSTRPCARGAHDQGLHAGERGRRAARPRSLPPATCPAHRSSRWARTAGARRSGSATPPGRPRPHCSRSTTTAVPRTKPVGITTTTSSSTARRADGHAAVLSFGDPRRRSRVGGRRSRRARRSSPPTGRRRWRSCSSTVATVCNLRDDFAGWTPHVAIGGTLAIHDVFPDPRTAGGRRTRRSTCPRSRAVGSLASVTGSLRTLRAWAERRRLGGARRASRRALRHLVVRAFTQCRRVSLRHPPSRSDRARTSALLYPNRQSCLISASRADHREWQDRQPELEGETEGAVLELLQLAGLRPRALRKDHHRDVVLESLRGSIRACAPAGVAAVELDVTARRIPHPTNGILNISVLLIHFISNGKCEIGRMSTKLTWLATTTYGRRGSLGTLPDTVNFRRVELLVHDGDPAEHQPGLVTTLVPPGREPNQPHQRDHEEERGAEYEP